MVQRTAKILLTVVMAIGLAHAGSSACFGWWNPFASNDRPPTTMVSRSTQKPPSAWTRITTGTKNFFNKAGETLGLKKKELKKAPPVVAVKPRTLQRPEKPGMFSWLAPKQDKPEDVKDWLGRTKQITP